MIKTPFILRNATWGLFLGIMLAFGLLAPQFLTLGNGLNVLVQAASLGIVATGMTFVLLTGGIDLSVGSIMFLSGVISAKLVLAGAPFWVAGLAVLGVGVVFGFVNAFFIYRVKIIPFIVTLATLYMGRGLGLFISQTRAINLPESILQLGSAKWLGVPLPVLILISVIAVAHVVLSHTPFGRQVYAVGNDPDKARKAGIRVERTLLVVYLISGFCAALGGLVSIAQLGAVSPTFGNQSEFIAIAAAVLGGASLFGGKGTVLPGTLLGAVFIQALQSGLVLINADPYVYPLITGSIIFVVVMIDSLRHKQEVRLRTLNY